MTTNKISSAANNTIFYDLFQNTVVKSIELLLNMW
nr:MAG TPA: hypothetical protein [Caudoviricetes sp.]